MLFMVLEHFKDRNGEAVYRRLREQGRMAPPGLDYIASWVEGNLDRCFQLMETSDPTLLDIWAANWRDLVDFEFISVMEGKDMAARMTPAP